MQILKHALLPLLLTSLALSADSMQNPPPTRAFVGYSGYELRPLELGPPYAGDKSNEKAAAKIQENLTAQLNPIVETWNKAVKPDAKPAKLLIVPRVDNIKFNSGAKRFWAGALAGDSSVVLTVKFVEEPGGTVVAEPEFYQRAAAMSGAWTVGGQDNAMLERIVTVASSYVTANYEQAVGGRTGREK